MWAPWEEEKARPYYKEWWEPPLYLAAGEPALTLSRPEWIENSILTAIQQQSMFIENP